MKLPMCIEAVLGFILAISGIAVAQLPPQGSPPQQTPPTFPQTSQPSEAPDNSQQPATPSGSVNDDAQTSSDQLENQINNDLRSDPALAGTDIHATVNANQVVLNGTASSTAQHERALRIASADAGNNSIVDQITTGGTSTAPEASEPNMPPEPTPARPPNQGEQPPPPRANPPY